MREERKCVVCGATYIAVNQQCKYCLDCRESAYDERRKRFKEAHPHYYRDYKRKQREKRSLQLAKN